jgi:hypothetical protein
MPWFTTVFFLFWEVQSGGPPPGGGLPIQTDFVCNPVRFMFRRGG